MTKRPPTPVQAARAALLPYSAVLPWLVAELRLRCHPSRPRLFGDPRRPQRVVDQDSGDVRVMPAGLAFQLRLSRPDGWQRFRVLRGPAPGRLVEDWPSRAGKERRRDKARAG